MTTCPGPGRTDKGVFDRPSRCRDFFDLGGVVKRSDAGAVDEVGAVSGRFKIETCILYVICSLETNGIDFLLAYCHINYTDM